MLKTRSKTRRVREGGGALYTVARLAFTQPFGGRFDRVLLVWSLSCILLCCGMLRTWASLVLNSDLDRILSALE